MCFSSYKNQQLKVKLWWVEARERKESVFFVTFFCPKEIILTFVIYLNVLNFQNKYTFKYHKTLLHTLFCLFSKSPKAFKVEVFSNCINGSVSDYKKIEIKLYQNIWFSWTLSHLLLKYIKTLAKIRRFL